MKRILSMLMVIATIITSTGFISACSSREASEITMGEWLVMVDEMFGMQSYTEKQPFFENITKENPYFDAVQIAVEWDVIDVEEPLDVDANLTYKQALITLVNVGPFVPLESGDEEKIDFAIKNFDNTIREYWLDRDIEATSAVELLQVAHGMWANKTYDVSYEKVELMDGVVDCTKGETLIDNYSIDENGDVLIPISESPQINNGDIFMLPANEQTLGVGAYEAEDIVVEDGYIRVKVKDDIELEDVVKEFEVAETVVANEDNIMIQDAFGNVMYMGDEVVTASVYDGVSNLAYDTQRNLISKNVSKNGASQTFKVDGFDVTLSYQVNDEKLNLSATVNGTLKKFEDGSQLKFNDVFSIDNLALTEDHKFGGSGLKSAYVRLDYKASNTTTFNLSGVVAEGVFAPYNNGNGKYLTNIKKAYLKAKGAPGAKTIKIGSVTLFGNPLARACIDVNLKVAADGTLTIVLTETAGRGVQYRNGSFRSIDDVNRDATFSFMGKVEATIGLGLAIYALRCKECIIGVGVNAGLGAKLSSNMKLVDEDRHLLETENVSDVAVETMQGLIATPIETTGEVIMQEALEQGVDYEIEPTVIKRANIEICLDGEIYGILELEVYGKVGTHQIGEWNPTLARVHVDDLDWSQAVIKWGASSSIDLCKYSYVPFVEEQETETVENTEDMENTELENTKGMLQLTEMKVNMDISDMHSISVSSYPEGYESDDIIFTSKDTSIVTVQGDGTIKAVGEGSTIITVSTKDGKYKAYCAVTVLAEEIDVL